MCRRLQLLVVLALLLLTANNIAWEQSAHPSTPQEAVDELLRTDREFSRKGAQSDLAVAISAMFAPDVAMLAPGQFARGVEAARAELTANPDNTGARAEWYPIRGGISADAQHGFTFGYMTIQRANKTRVRAKYVAYWIKQPEGWRVVVYKRARAADAEVPLEVMPPSLPVKLMAVSTDAALIRNYRDSLDATERAFSDEAQKIGLAAAFANYGHADAVNVGPPTDPAFVKGAEAIGRAVSGGSTSTDPGLSWAPDNVIVASSGDLGVTLGMIRVRTLGPDGKLRPPIPFITIWRRATSQAAWRYIAE
jgi:ketosteroid isomerase-like protein